MTHVSPRMAAIKKPCDRVRFLRDGRLVPEDVTTAEVVAKSISRGALLNWKISLPT
jgi:ABC-type sugar transport system ATPase subunit